MRRGQSGRGLRELGGQQRHARRLVERRVVLGRAGRLDQLGHDALVHVGILADVELGEMEAEHVDRAPQRAQPAARQARRGCWRQRVVDRVEIGLELVRRLVGRRRSDRRMRRFELVERPRRCGEARIHAGQRAAIGLVLALGGGIGRAVGQRLQRVGDMHHRPVERQLGAEQMKLLEMMAQRALALHRKRLARHLGGDVGIAVAVAADPAAHAQEGRHVEAELVLEVGVEFRQRGQEGVIVVGERIGDLVEHAQAGMADQAGLPQGQDVAAQRAAIVVQLLGRELDPVALVEQVRDLALAVDRALAAHLGRMRGQHRDAERAGEEALELLARDAGVLRAGQRIGHGAAPRRRLGHGVGAGAPDVVLVLGEIGEVREIAEGADDADRLAVGRPLMIDCSSRRAASSALRWNCTPVRRMCSTRSNTCSPSWERTVSPRMRPSSRVS